MRPATVEDRDRALQLFRRAFGDVGAAVTPDIWDWLFVRNPAADRLYYLVADAGDRLAGQYATAPVLLQHRAETVRALVSLHTATDPDFERQGIFRTLAEQLYRESAADAPVVYGFPNPRSAPVFYAKLGWTELRPFPLVVRPLSGPAGVIASLGARGLSWPFRRSSADCEIASFERFGDWADDLWSELSPLLGTCVVRNAVYLNWRFADAPYTYRKYVCVRAGEPVAFVVLRFAPWRGRTAAYLMELMARPGDRIAAQRLLAHAIADARESGASVALSIVSRRHPHRRGFLGASFVPLPGRVRTSFSFGVRPTRPEVDDESWATGHEWSITGADLDFI